MALKAIVSYDDTANDHDALVLGRVLAGRRAAHARLRAPHDPLRARAAKSSRSMRPRRCSSAAPAGSATSTWHAASSSAPRPARAFSSSPSEEDADLVVFGSDYRTAPGHVLPQHSAQTLLEGGPDGRRRSRRPNYRADRRPRSAAIGLLGDSDDDAAAETAYALAERLGAKPDPRSRARSTCSSSAPGPRRARAGDAQRPDPERARGRDRSRRSSLARGVALRPAAARHRLSRTPSGRGAADIVAPRAHPVVSDLHLGARLGHDVLRRPAPLPPAARGARRRRSPGPARRRRRADGGPHAAGDGDRRAGAAGDRRSARRQPARS